jgi:outer membrane immunogenic protein
MVSDSRAMGAVALAAAAGASMGSANAADLLKAPAPVIAPSWQGFYVGGSLGATWLNSAQDDSANFVIGYGPAFAPGSRTTSSGIGWLAGLQAGYNWQDRNFVYGVEGDISWLGNTSAGSNGLGSASYTRNGVEGGVFTYGYQGATTKSSKINALATLRARFGIDFNGTMPYLTAGFALGDIKNTYTQSTSSGTGYSTSTSTTSWVPGLALGGGIEHQLSNHWTLRGEVLWVGFKDVSLNAPLLGTGTGSSYGGGGTVRFTNSLTIAKIGMNYKF